jgi:hypothetical protein
VYQWCGFKSRRGKNKNLTALKSNSNTVWFNFQTYKLNQTVLELDFRAVNFFLERLLEIGLSETRIVCGDHVCQRIGMKCAICIEDLP